MNEIIEPKTYSEAIESGEKEHWLTAMQEEIESHESHGTWELMNLPPGKTVIGGKRVLKTKTGIDGEITRYVIVYADDLIVVCETAEQLQEIVGIFKSHFVMKNLGPIRHYLGMEVSKDDDGNFQLCQSAYITKIANDFELTDAKTAKTPMEIGFGK